MEEKKKCRKIMCVYESVGVRRVVASGRAFRQARRRERLWGVGVGERRAALQGRQERRGRDGRSGRGVEGSGRRKCAWGGKTVAAV